MVEFSYYFTQLWRREERVVGVGKQSLIYSPSFCFLIFFSLSFCILGSESCFNVVGMGLYIQGFALAQSLAKVLVTIGGKLYEGVNKSF